MWGAGGLVGDDTVISEQNFILIGYCIFSLSGSPLPYRRTSYLGQTIQCSLETMPSMGTILFFPQPLFKNCENQANIFFQNNAVSQDLWKRQLGLNFFQFKHMIKKSGLYKASIYMCPNIHAVCLSINGKEYFS